MASTTPLTAALLRLGRPPLDGRVYNWHFLTFALTQARSEIGGICDARFDRVIYIVKPFAKLVSANLWRQVIKDRAKQCVGG